MDLNRHVLTVPDELPELPYADELAQELSEVLAKYSKKQNGPLPTSGRSSPSQIPRKKSSDFRLTARKAVKKIDAFKAGLSRLHTSRSTSNLTSSDGLNPRLASLEKIRQKTGIQTNVPMDSSKVKSYSAEDLDTIPAVSTLCPKELRRLDFNLEIREILVNWFTQVFLDYESFVIHPLDDQDMEQWIQNREQMENFDKAAFLSDQPGSFLPFLAPFVETQMFATFIDTKLIGWWAEADSRLAVFDQRISQMKNRLGIVRSHSYERCQSVKSARKYCKITDCNVKLTRLQLFNYFCRDKIRICQGWVPSTLWFDRKVVDMNDLRKTRGLYFERKMFWEVLREIWEAGFTPYYDYIYTYTLVCLFFVVVHRAPNKLILQYIWFHVLFWIYMQI